MSSFKDLVTQAKSHAQTFILWPKQWRNYPKHNLVWNTIRFVKSELGYLPASPGVYAFLILPDIEPDLNASYLLYIGKTERTLKERGRDYYNKYKKKTGRPKFLDLLPRYRGHIYFTYATTNIPVQVEDDLLEALIPPANKRFPATISAVIRAFNY